LSKKKSPKKRKRIPTIQATTIPNQLRKARSYHIKECFITEGWQDGGICNIFILREKPDFNFILGVYLIDIWCLGLKDTFFNLDVSYEEIADRLHNHPSGKNVAVDVDFAHSMIYGGIDYAKQLGFSPHSDFKYTRFILDPKEEIEFDGTIEFGKDGKPFYMAGPYDSREKISRIIEQLEEKVGEGNYHFTYPVDDL